MKLNLGCGNERLKNYINIDIDPGVKPDLVLDIARQPLPYDNNSIEQVLFFHTIEHIERGYHSFILTEVNRVLEPEGTLLLAFPDFIICAKRYIENFRGQERDWEACIFGRGLTVHDMHVCGIKPREMAQFLMEHGFKDIRQTLESGQDHHCVMSAVKAFTLVMKEDLLSKELDLSNLK